MREKGGDAIQPSTGHVLQHTQVMPFSLVLNSPHPPKVSVIPDDKKAYSVSRQTSHKKTKVEELCTWSTNWLKAEPRAE